MSGFLRPEFYAICASRVTAHSHRQYREEPVNDRYKKLINT